MKDAPVTQQDELPPTEEASQEEVFAYMAAKQQQRLSIPRSDSFSRKDVVNAFNAAFELVGGIPRLAMWAHENPGDFYRIYGKLLPSQSQNIVGDDGTLKIELAIKPSSLDELPADHIVDGEYTEMEPDL